MNNNYLDYPINLYLPVVSDMLAELETKCTLEESKIFWCAVSKINARDEGNWVTLPKQELVDQLEIDTTNNSKIYDMLRRIVLKSYIDFDGDTEKEWMSGVLLIGFKSIKNDISVQFNPTYLPFLDKLYKFKDE